jgi:hypothetical protein
MNILRVPSFVAGLAKIDNDYKGSVEAIQKIEKPLLTGDIHKCLDLFYVFMEQAEQYIGEEKTFLETIDFTYPKLPSAAYKRLLGVGRDALKVVVSDVGQEAVIKCLEAKICSLLKDVIAAGAEFKSYAQKKGLI